MTIVNKGKVLLGMIVSIIFIFSSNVSAICVLTGYVYNSTGDQIGISGGEYVSIYCDDVLKGGANPDETDGNGYGWTDFVSNCQVSCSGTWKVNITSSQGEYGETFASPTPTTTQRIHINTTAPPQPTSHNNQTVNDNYSSESVSIYWNMSDDGATDSTISGNFSYNTSNYSTVTTTGSFTAGGTQTFSNFMSMAAGTIVYWWSTATGEGLTTISEVFQFIVQKIAGAISLIAPSGGWTQTYPAVGNANCSDQTGGQVTPTFFRNGTSIGLIEDVSSLSAGGYSYVCNVSMSENYTAASESKVLTISKNTNPLTLSITNATYGDTNTVVCSNNTNGQSDVKMFRNLSEVGLDDQTSALAAGIYEYICNTTATTNYSIESENGLLLISQDNSLCDVLFNETSPVIYGTSFNSYTNCDTTSTMYRNGSIYTNNSVNSLGAGNYNFTVVRTDTQNYSNVYDEGNFVVNQNPSSCDVIFNETSPVTYGTSFNSYTNCDTAFTMYRNGSIYTNNSVNNLAAGSYNFTVVRTDTQNYSNVYDEGNFVVSKIDPGLNLVVNSSSVAHNEAVNMSCSVSVNDIIPLKIYTAGGVEVASGNNYIEFIFAAQDGANHNGTWTCNSTTVENYTADSDTQGLIVGPAFGINSVECSNDSESNWYNCSSFNYGETITHIRAEINNIGSGTDYKFNLRNIDDATDYISNQSNTSISGSYAVYATGGYLLRDSGDWELNVTAYGPITETNSQTFGYIYGNISVDWINPLISGNLDWLQFENINVNVSCENGECGALNSTLYSGTQTSITPGATPFYTTDNNPQSVSALYGGDSEVINWNVNSTGTIGVSYDFFVNANMTTNTGDVLDNSSTHLSMRIYFNDTTSPVIIPKTSPTAAVNGSSIVINATITDDVQLDSSWANLTYPNGTSILINNIPSTFTDTSQIGRYDLIYYANDTSGNLASEVHGFDIAANFTATINLSVDIGSGIGDSTDVIFQLVHPDFGGVVYETTANGTFNATVPNIKYNFVFLGAFNGTMNITLREVNLSENQGNSIALDKHRALTNYLVTYGVHTDYIFNLSEVLFAYGDEAFTNEANLKLFRCNSSFYNFSGRSCSAAWEDVTSLASQNITGNYFKLDTSTFSGYSIYETPATTTAGGGGGGGGGGANVGGTVVEPVNVTAGVEGQSGENKTLPSELFDIRMDLEDTTIDFSNQLQSVITFASFGRVPTFVNLTHRIYDLNGNLLYEEFGNVTVTTEEILRKSFPNLNLPDGEYKYTFSSLYNTDVYDEYSQNFIVGKKGIGDFLKNNILWIAAGLAALALVYFGSKFIRLPKSRVAARKTVRISSKDTSLAKRADKMLKGVTLKKKLAKKEWPSTKSFAKKILKTKPSKIKVPKSPHSDAENKIIKIRKEAGIDD